MIPFPVIWHTLLAIALVVGMYGVVLCPLGDDQ